MREILEDVEYVNEKVSHRLVQGCGRCNRNPSDRAIYFILDGRLAADILGDSRIFKHFPNRMRAEADYGQEFAETGGLDGAIAEGRLLLDKKLKEFDHEIDDRMVQESEVRVEQRQRPFLREIQAWHDLCERHNYLDAAKAFENAAAECATDSDRYRSWLHYLAAFGYYLAESYYHDKPRRKDVINNLEIAIKSGYTSWFSGLQVVVHEINQSTPDKTLLVNLESQAFKERVIRAWQEFFSANRSKKETPYQAWERICRTILKGRHDEMCDAVGSMLELIGFEVHSLRRETGKPDILVFSTAGEKYLCIVETKTADQGDELTRDEVDQVTGHRAGYQSQYPDHQVFALVFTNKQRQSPTALDKAKFNARILTAPVFLAFLRKYFERMEQAPKAAEPTIRLSLLEKIPTLNRLIPILKPQEAPLVEQAELDGVLS